MRRASPYQMSFVRLKGNPRVLTAARTGDTIGAVRSEIDRKEGLWIVPAARLKGKKGAFRDVALLNAAAGLMVAGRAKDLQQAVALAEKSIDSGEADARLQRLIKVSNA